MVHLPLSTVLVSGPSTVKHRIGRWTIYRLERNTVKGRLVAGWLQASRTKIFLALISAVGYENRSRDFHNLSLKLTGQKNLWRGCAVRWLIILACGAKPNLTLGSSDTYGWGGGGNYGVIKMQKTVHESPTTLINECSGREPRRMEWNGRESKPRSKECNAENRSLKARS